MNPTQDMAAQHSPILYYLSYPCVCYPYTSIRHRMNALVPFPLGPLPSTQESFASPQSPPTGPVSP